jgi:hypothetical protein
MDILEYGANIDNKDFLQEETHPVEVKPLAM